MNKIVLNHILEQYNGKQLFVALHAPQGCGKTTLCKYLKSALSLRGYKTLTISLDDFYLPSNKMNQVISDFNHPLYKYRGLAGTHDVDLLFKCLTKLKQGNSTFIPVFNKTLEEGRGDIERFIYHPCKFDIIILEGWMIGYKPQAFVPQNLTLFNNLLKKYKFLHEFFKLWICFETNDLENIYKWRWSSEEKLNESEFKEFMKPYMEVYKTYIVSYKNKYIVDIDRNIISN